MGRGGGTAGPCTLSRRASPASRLCMPRPPGECQKASVGKGHTCIQRSRHGGGVREGKGTEKAMGRTAKIDRSTGTKSAERERSTGTRKQKQRGWRVGTGGGKEVSRG